MFFKVIIRYHFKQRLVIFINKYNHSFTGSFVSGFDYMSESLRLWKLFLIKLITILPFCKMLL